MPSVTTTFKPQPESAIAGNLVEEGVTVDTDTEDHFRRSTYSVAELEIKQPGRKSTCHIT